MTESHSPARIQQQLSDLLQRGQRVQLVTVVETTGSTPAKVGAKMLVLPTGKTIGTVGGGALENQAIETAKELLSRGESLLQEYVFGQSAAGGTAPGRIAPGRIAPEAAIRLPMLCGGKTTLFYEFLGNQGNVIIFGAGHVGRALAYHLAPGNLHVTVVDTRKEVLDAVSPDWITTELATDYQKIVAERKQPVGSYCVVATHSHEEDYRILKTIIESSWQPAYIGVIASAGKARDFRKKLQKECKTTLPLEKLHMPCGLDTGGPTPHEIAISVVAEIQTVRFAKTGHRHMRERAKDD